MDANNEVLWQARKKNWMGLPSFTTKYTLYYDRLMIKSGFFTVTEDEIRLYRLTDITLKRNFWQRLTGVGTLHLCSSDATMPELDIVNVKHPKELRDRFSDLMDNERSKRNITIREGGMTGMHTDYMHPFGEGPMNGIPQPPPEHH